MKVRNVVMSNPTPQQDDPTPYGTAAELYWQAGWRGILPLPARRKANPPNGYTGRDGAWPSYPDVFSWIEDHATGNICLRLPPDVIGVDVDHYGSKLGGDILAQLEAQLGELPPTWRVTSRDDGVSGIRLFRVPPGLRWPGVFGAGIESIRAEHRYAVVWPSIHPEGRTYRWIGPDGLDRIGDVPDPNSLPDLPPAWVEHFTNGGQLATDQAHAVMAGEQVDQWLRERGQGMPCKHVQHAAARGLHDIVSGSSRHDATLGVTNRLIWLAGEGHTGVYQALVETHRTFMQAVAGDRDPADADAEWWRMLDGAVRMAAAAHPTPSTDPCLDPFHGLIPKGDSSWLTPPSTSSTLASPPSTAPGSLPSSATPPTTPSSPATPSSTSSSGWDGSPAPSPADTTTSTTPATTDAPSASTAATDGSSTSPPEPERAPDGRERTTWWPRNGDRALDDDEPEPPPAQLVRDDGQAVFYQGRVNGLIGPSESGKSWVALHAVVQAMQRGERATYIDFEDTHKGLLGRLRSCGVPDDVIRSRFAYINPDEPFYAEHPTGQDIGEHLGTWQPAIVVIDGVNAAMTLQGYDLNDNKDATLFAQKIMKPIAEVLGACVIYVDHVAKSTDENSRGGIGAQAKRAMTTGCCLKVEVIDAFGKGQNGKLRLRVDKDRQGDVRGASLPNNKLGHWAGDILILSNADTGTVEIAFRSPDSTNAARAASPTTFRPTVLMERISVYLEAAAEGASQRNIREDVTGKANYIKDAVDLLVSEGYVAIAPRQGRGGGSVYVSVKPFRKDSKPEVVPGSQPVPNRFPEPDGSGSPEVVPSGPPLQGTGTTSGTTSAVQDPLPGGSGSPRIVERMVAGERVRFDLDTGEIVDD